MYRGTTPTLTLTLPEGTDFSGATVYVTLADSTKKEVLTTTDVDINENVISVYLSQEQTLALPKTVLVQVNWTYGNGQRACSNIVSFNTTQNLINGVL